MYLDGNLVETTPVFGPLMRQASYLKNIMAGLEKKYAAILKKFAVKPVYCLCGVQSCMNSFIPLPAQISQHKNISFEKLIQPANKLEGAPLSSGQELPVSSGTTIHPPKIKAA